MCFTNGFLKYKKEFCLLQAVAFLKDLAPNDMHNFFQGILQDFSGNLTTLKEVNFENRKTLRLGRHFFRELASSKYFTETNFREQVCFQ